MGIFHANSAALRSSWACRPTSSGTTRSFVRSRAATGLPRTMPAPGFASVLKRTTSRRSAFFAAFVSRSGSGSSSTSSSKLVGCIPECQMRCSTPRWVFAFETRDIEQALGVGEGDLCPAATTDLRSMVQAGLLVQVGANAARTDVASRELMQIRTEASTQPRAFDAVGLFDPIDEADGPSPTGLRGSASYFRPTGSSWV